MEDKMKLIDRVTQLTSQNNRLKKLIMEQAQTIMKQKKQKQNLLIKIKNYEDKIRILEKKQNKQNIGIINSDKSPKEIQKYRNSEALISSKGASISPKSRERSSSPIKTFQENNSDQKERMNNDLVIKYLYKKKFSVNSGCDKSKIVQSQHGIEQINSIKQQKKFKTLKQMSGEGTLKNIPPQRVPITNQHTSKLTRKLTYFEKVRAN